MKSKEYMLWALVIVTLLLSIFNLIETGHNHGMVNILSEQLDKQDGMIEFLLGQLNMQDAVTTAILRTQGTILEILDSLIQMDFNDLSGLLLGPI